jgi:hypothetical protein
VRQAAAGASASAAPARRQAEQRVTSAAKTFAAVNSFDVAEGFNAPPIATGLYIAAPVQGSQTYSANSLVTR